MKLNVPRLRVAAATVAAIASGVAPAGAQTYDLADLQARTAIARPTFGVAGFRDRVTALNDAIVGDETGRTQRRDGARAPGPPAGTGEAAASPGKAGAAAPSSASLGRNESSNPASTTVSIVREFWLLKDENQGVVIRCPNGAERQYNYFPKTGRYCTPTMSCNSDRQWIHRALC